MFSFTPNTIPHNIFVIGAGGTGSRLMPLLSQFMRSITRGTSPTGWIENPTIWVVDDDTVEQKNILRQNFIDMDVGKPKATVLAERYSRAYGTNIIPLNVRISDTNRHSFIDALVNTLQALNLPSDNNAVNSIISTSIVIMCVDSVDARREILNVFVTNSHCQSIFFIDSGNEDNFGQVSFFNPCIINNKSTYEQICKEEPGKTIPKLVTGVAELTSIPMDIEYYRNLVDTPAQGSCADLNQTLAINAIMATTIMGIVQNYYYRKPFTYNAVHISLNGSNFTTYNSFNNFKNMAVSEEAYRNCARGYYSYSNKSGSTKNLTFTVSCKYVGLHSYADNLLKAIAQQKAKEEAEAREEAKKLALESEAASKKTSKKGKGYKFDTYFDAEETTPQQPASSILEVVTEVPDASVPLVPIPRNRRQVALNPVVPDAWVAEALAVPPPPPHPFQVNTVNTEDTSLT